MYYSEEIIDEVRQQSDIVSIISEYTALNKKGQSYLGLCPFHNEKTPSFSVSEDKQMYYCFGCGAGGNIITFMMQKENMTFPEAIQYLADKAHIDLDSLEQNNGNEERINRKQQLLEVYTKAARFYYFSLHQQENNHALKYFQNRDISEETIKHFGLGYAPSQYNILYQYMKREGYEDALLEETGLFLKSKEKGILFDRFSDRVMFPIFNLNKKVVAFGGRVLGDELPKYLNSPESTLFDKSRTLYGLHLARQQKHPYFILVEGYMDVIAMHKAGFTQTVASLGTAFTDGHAKLLKRQTEQVVILYDSDAAGKKAALRAIPILKANHLNIKVLQLPDGKDPDEFLNRHGAMEMQKLLEEAQSDTWFRVKELEKQYHLELANDKVAFLQEVAKLIATLESSIEQNIYAKEVAQAYQIATTALEAEIKKYYGFNQKASLAKPKVEKSHDVLTGTLPMQLEFLNVLYNYPRLYPHIKNYISPELFEAGLIQDLAKHIFETLESGRAIETAHFVKHYTEVKDQKMLSSVLMKTDSRYEDEDVQRKMITESIKRLNLAWIEKQLKSTTDIQVVKNLLSQKKVLDKLYIEFING